MHSLNLKACCLLALCALAASCGGGTGAPPDTGETSAGQAGYAEKHRPQFHFSPKEKWTNDPNGMVYFDGCMDSKDMDHPGIRLDKGQRSPQKSFKK